MRHISRSPMRRAAAVLGTTILLAATFVIVGITGGGVAHASDDWTTGHTGPRACSSKRDPISYAYVDPTRDTTPSAATQPIICWSGTDVSVQGYAEDIASSYCALNRIRYQVNINRTWPGWQVHYMATTCGNRSSKSSTWWWSAAPVRSLQSQACLREGSTGAAVHCSSWA